MVMKVKEALDRAFVAPGEGLSTLNQLLNSDVIHKLDKLLLQVERISKDSSSLPQVIELLKLIQQMNETGALDKLNKLLQAIPKGKSGEAMVTELRKVITELVPRLDKLSSLVSTLLREE